MTKNKKIEPDKGIITNRMDVGTDSFDEFQAILLNKSKEKSIEQKRKVDLLAIKFRMEDYLKSEGQDIRLAGDFLKSYLKTLHIKQNKFAQYIGLNPSNLSKLIGGDRPINYELALILGNIFKTDPMLWIEIQAKNELKKLRKTRKNKYQNYSLNDLINE
ncbi:MAG: addiction module antidote protein, HigA family [Bacteroidota bacterium]